jgi:hypothetical protein
MTEINGDVILKSNIRKVQHKSCHTCKEMIEGKCQFLNLSITTIYLITEATLTTEVVCDGYGKRKK